MVIRFITSAGVLWAAEVLASLSIWHGTPTDWRGEPLHFWSNELWRLKYWAILFLLAVALWLVSCRALPPRGRGVLLWLIAAVLALGVEVFTSIWSWKQLPWSDDRFLGWPSYFPDYLWDHLISWIVVVALGAGIWYLWRRRRTSHRIAPTVP
jgi:hypothetical protein